MIKTAYPKRSNELLHTPGRGYVLYDTFGGKVPEGYEEHQEVFEKCFETASCYDLKIRWLEIQPNSEDEYDWSQIDDLLALAEKNKKKVMFGFGSWVKTGGVYDGIRHHIPEWVYEAGAKYNDIECANYLMGGVNIDRIPDWDDPVYREKNEKFIEAVAKRYDGHPCIECVVNYNHGNWGEWHHFDINKRPCDKENLYIDFKGRKLGMDYFKYYVDLYPKYFKKSPLAMPVNCFDTFDELEPWAKYAIDTYGYGLKREGLITIEDCTYAMKYCAGKGVAFGEWQTDYQHYTADGRWTDGLLDRGFIDGKLTHYNLGRHGTKSWNYMVEKPEQIRYWANHMGYYYSVTACVYTEDGADITICNDGVTATYLHPEAEFAVIKKGNVVKEWKSLEINLREVGEKEEKTFHVSFSDAMAPDTILGLRFWSGQDEMLLANEKDTSGYYLMQDDGNVYVDFDHRPRSNERLNGRYMGIDFGEQAWYTNLRRENYETCLYADIYLNDYTMEIVIPEGMTLKSVKAFGYGSIKLIDCNNQEVTIPLGLENTEYETGFTGASGRVKLRLQSSFSCWSIQITGFVYGK